MPRIADEQVQDSDLYGVTKVENNLTLRERIKTRFRPTDTVKVWNPTNQNCKWQWLDEQDETYRIDEDTEIKITDRERPGLWELGAGEHDVLIGACAYMFIESLYKQVCIMKIGIVINPLSENEIRNFSLDDPEKQEQFIDTVFVSKLSPQDMQLAAIRGMGEESSPKVEMELPKLATSRDELKKRQDAQRSMQQTPVRSMNDLADEFEPGGALLGTATGGLPSDDHRPVPAAEKPEAPKETPKSDKPAAAEKPAPKKEVAKA